MVNKPEALFWGSPGWLAICKNSSHRILFGGKYTKPQTSLSKGDQFHHKNGHIINLELWNRGNFQLNKKQQKRFAK